MDRPGTTLNEVAPLPLRSVLRIVRMQRHLSAAGAELSTRLHRYCGALRRLTSAEAISLEYRPASGPETVVTRVRPQVPPDAVDAARLRTWLEFCRNDERFGDHAAPRWVELDADLETVDPGLVTRLIGLGRRHMAIVHRGRSATRRVICRALFADDRDANRPGDTLLLLLRALLPTAAALDPSRRSIDLQDVEVDTLRLLLGGRTEKEIARELRTSHGSIHHRLKKIYRTYAVTSRAELSSLFVDRELLKQLQSPRVSERSSAT